jgi:glycopeptide antibiotics resistance protein
VRAPAGSLIGAALYVAMLLPWLVMDNDAHAHPRAYLLEFRLALTKVIVRDALLNVAAFVPLGWLLMRGIRDLAASTAVRLLIVVAFCAALSLTMETLQFFVPSRYSSLIDVLANTTGAVVGAVVVAWGVREPAGPR